MIWVFVRSVLSTCFENVPAYVEAQDIPVTLPRYGEVRADVVWGGNYFGIIDLTKTSLRIAPEGLLGTGTFEGCLLGEIDLGGHRGVRPAVKGTANL